MSYAPYTNDQVNVHNGLMPLLGKFEEKEYGQTFEFALRLKDVSDGFASLEEFPHVIFVGGINGRTRYANVKKTVAYVVIDEDASGKPVIEKWQIKHYRKYANQVFFQVLKDLGLPEK